QNGASRSTRSELTYSFEMTLNACRGLRGVNRTSASVAPSPLPSPGTRVVVSSPVAHAASVANTRMAAVRMRPAQAPGVPAWRRLLTHGCARWQLELPATQRLRLRTISIVTSPEIGQRHDSRTFVR